MRIPNTLPHLLGFPPILPTMYLTLYSTYSTMRLPPTSPLPQCGFHLATPPNLMRFPPNFLPTPPTMQLPPTLPHLMRFLPISYVYYAVSTYSTYILPDGFHLPYQMRLLHSKYFFLVTRGTKWSPVWISI